ncbi:indolethylamine N-methyltransferase [Ixodes scapularis]
METYTAASTAELVYNYCETDVMSSVQSEALREAYKRNFEPDTYINFCKACILPTYQQTEIHRIFYSDLAQGKTLLEVGAGPTVNYVLSATRQFKDIVLSDVVDANRIELEKWLSGKEDALDCSFRAEMVASLEGCSDVKKRASELVERTRQAIRKVIPCDVLEPGVLPDEHLETFDAVLSCNCLESATRDHASFRRVTCNVAGLVKPGGLLILAGVGGQENYPVGNEVFPMADVNEDVIKKALADAGLNVEVYQTEMYDGPDRDAVGRRFAFVIAARKA